MNFINKLKDELEKRKSSIRAKGELSGTNWGELSITSLNENPITLGVATDDIKFRFQTLISGAILLQGDYRLDNCHGVLHQHFRGSESPVEIQTLSGALLHILGSEFGGLK